LLFFSALRDEELKNLGTNENFMLLCSASLEVYYSIFATMSLKNSERCTYISRLDAALFLQHQLIFFNSFSAKTIDIFTVSELILLFNSRIFGR
jgi:hypothetical protein